MQTRLGWFNSNKILQILRASYSQVITSGFHPDDYGSNPYARTTLKDCMNYKNLYDKIVRKVQARGRPDGYYETHHILPRSLGGSDDPENLVDVTAREHFILHYLLTKFTDGGDRRSMLHAFMLMAGSNGGQDRYINSRLYDSKKVEFAEAQRQRFTGVPKTEEHKQKISQALTGKVTSEATKQKQSESATKRKRKPFSPEYRAAMSAKMREVKAKKIRDCSSVG